MADLRGDIERRQAVRDVLRVLDSNHGDHAPYIVLCVCAQFVMLGQPALSPGQLYIFDVESGYDADKVPPVRRWWHRWIVATLNDDDAQLEALYHSLDRDTIDPNELIFLAWETAIEATRLRLANHGQAGA